MTFTVTDSPSIVRHIMTHPKVYSRITDDYCGPPEKFVPPMQAPIWHLIVMDDQELLGGFMLCPESKICWQIHYMLLPKSWGKSRQITLELREWIWKNTTCLRLYAVIAAFNTPALVLAKYGGMKEFGRNPKAFMKRGRLHDLVYLGISKEGI